MKHRIQRISELEDNFNRNNSNTDTEGKKKNRTEHLRSVRQHQTM